MRPASGSKSKSAKPRKNPAMAEPLNLLYGVIITHGLFFGIAFGVRNAIFMGMTNPAVAATQFTAFMGMGNLAISMGNYRQGIIAERFDYAAVFLPGFIIRNHLVVDHSIFA
jgi:PAT family beta-lactamase induction signal transducer AmpG